MCTFTQKHLVVPHLVSKVEAFWAHQCRKAWMDSVSSKARAGSFLGTRVLSRSSNKMHTIWALENFRSDISSGSSHSGVRRTSRWNVSKQSHQPFLMMNWFKVVWELLTKLYATRSRFIAFWRFVLGAISIGPLTNTRLNHVVVVVFWIAFPGEGIYHGE